MAITFNGSTNAIGGLAVGGLPDGTVDTDTLASSVSRLTNYDEWRYISDITLNNNSETDITANLSRVVNESVIGSAMTESSGVFTFPSTGIWLIHCFGNFYRTGGSRRFVGWRIKYSSDNGSNWSTLAAATHNMSARSGVVYVTPSCTTPLDVTDTSNQKIKFAGFCTSTEVHIRGSASYNSVSFNFTRIGDT